MLREPFAFEVLPGRNESTRIVRLTGPFILQNIFGLQDALSKQQPAVTIFDMSGVPYMDSAGIGVITNYYVSAAGRGNKVIVAGASSRILDVFKVTRVDNVIPMAASVEEAEALA